MNVRPRREDEQVDCQTVVETTAAEFLALRRLLEREGLAGKARFLKWLEGKTILIERGGDWKELEGERLEEMSQRGWAQNCRR